MLYSRYQYRVEAPNIVLRTHYVSISVNDDDEQDGIVTNKQPRNSRISVDLDLCPNRARREHDEETGESDRFEGSSLSRKSLL